MSSSIKAALIANGTIAVSKTVGAFFTGSASMAAEAVHSFADCGNQLLLMLGIKTSQRKADIDHPLGYGKDTYFWSFIVALVLFSLGGAYSLYEGIHKFMHPEPLKYVGWACTILLFGFVMELKSLSVCVKEIKEEYPGRSLRWFFKETRRPDLLVVFGEDVAALLGLGIAGAFLGIAAFTGNPIWDAVGSMAVGVLLMFVACGLFWETKAMLIGQSVEPQVRRKLREHLSNCNRIEHTYECITMQMGNDAVLLIRARFVEKDDASVLIDDINELERALFLEFPQFTKIFVEPDNKFHDF